jgi:hypothetical protein
MKEQLISFETAKLAKEKGFDNDSANYYVTSGRLNVVNGEDMFDAPTQSLLQKWLREKHDINVVASATVNMWFYNSEYISTGKLIVSTSEQSYDTYEDAIEKGLQEALKLI